MISVIGAGPIGSYTAYLLAKQKKVEIFEEHSEAGIPLQCAGINSFILGELLKVPEGTITNRTRKARVYSPDGNSVEISFKKPELIIDRTKFDKFLLKKAEKEGAEVYFNHKFVGKSGDNIKLKAKNKAITKKTDILVGADGPLSAVAKSAGLFRKRKFLQGIQVTAQYKNQNIIEFYPYIGAYAWVVPESKSTARIGIAAYSNAKQVFNSFLKKLEIKKTIDMQAGLIPIYDRQIPQKNNTYLVGDATCQVKATTGGGIVPGIIAANLLSRSIIKKESYTKNLKKLNKELALHKTLRKYLDKMDIKDWSLLIKLAKKEHSKNILQEYSRDFPSKFIFKLLLKELRYLYFSKLFFR